MLRLLPWTLCLVVLIHAGTALADGLPILLPEPGQKAPQLETLRSVKLRSFSARELREEPAEASPSRERRINRFQTAKGGFKFQDRFEFSGHSYRYSVRGPVQENKRLGLTFELRF